MGIEPAIHWFRRDLRLFDHQALARAGEGGRPVIGLFVLDPTILERPDTGPSRVAYLAGALAALDAGLRRKGSRLVVRRGDARVVVPASAAETGAALVTAIRDFEPFARARDEAVATALATDGRELWLSAEQLLLDPTTLPPLRTFSACRRRFESALAEGVPRAPRSPGFLPARSLPRTDRLPGARALGFRAADAVMEAGERPAARRLATFAESRLSDYANARDDPAADATSRLSADLRFGVVSVRTAIRAALEAGRAEPRAEAGVKAWLNELAWRDFYASLLWHFPEVETLEYKAELRGLRWGVPGRRLDAWVNGRTGYPIVDAAMRQLAGEHFMHNRCRMIVASFLVKDLHLDWRLGERHFMRELVDGDLANNNGGWQWCASTGADSQPHFRIFNPVLQGERHDPTGAYVRRWVPELRQIPDRYIHRPWEAPSPPKGYAPRIVDHGREREVALKLYRRQAIKRRAAPPG